MQKRQAIEGAIDAAFDVTQVSGMREIIDDFSDRYTNYYDFTGDGAESRPSEVDARHEIEQARRQVAFGALTQLAYGHAIENMSTRLQAAESLIPEEGSWLDISSSLYGGYSSSLKKLLDTMHMRSRVLIR